MSIFKSKKNIRIQRRRRIRAKISGTKDKPRFCVFKSNKYLYAQIIDDEKGNTLVSATTKGKKGDNSLKAANELGKEIASSAKSKKISKVVFDRGGFIYTGKIKAIAEGAREGGLIM